MECSFQFLKLCHIETRRRLLVLGVVAVTYLLFQWLLLPYENALRSLLPQSQVPKQVTGSFLAVHSSTKSVMVRNPLTVNSSDSIDPSRFGGVDKYAHSSSLGGEIARDNEPKEKEARYDFPEPIVLSKDEISTENTLEENTALTAKNSEGVKTAFLSSPLILPAAASLINGTDLNYLVSNASSSVGSASLESDVVIIKNGSVTMTSPGKKKMRCNMPPKSITSIHEMNHTLVRHHAKARAMV